jgi:hypothetical protein
LIEFLSGPKNEKSSKRLLAFIAVLVAAALSFVHPLNIALITVWLTFSGALLGIATFSKT